MKGKLAQELIKWSGSPGSIVKINFDGAYDGCHYKSASGIVARNAKEVALLSYLETHKKKLVLLYMVPTNNHQWYIWPSHDEVQRLIEKFYQAPEFERIKKMMNLETYMKEKISKSCKINLRR
ncbi:hypothetical protein J1N35_019326 [Gossypium stocksii]|uniref:Uncharacterized protein n=1 Tax=Gossypium stocksii TaxID=47602 RepID=A0A9D3VQQ6_9ROSI|nr:hypothetical protein J1N35_019326 [Gossypium stocksii]